MPDAAPQRDALRLEAPINNLLGTLSSEYEALLTLHAHFDAQMDALRRRDHHALETATLDVNAQVHELERLRQARLRQTRLLGRLSGMPDEEGRLQTLASTLSAMPNGGALAQHLLDARQRVRDQAEQTRQRCDEFEFALQYAVRLSREMVQVMQELDVPPPSRIYTASGHSSQTAPPRSFVNRVG